jgi:hypothetical protein
MKSNIIIFAIFVSISINAQLVYRPMSNFVNTNSKKGTISIMPSVGIGTIEAQVSYNFIKNYNIYGMYNNSDGEFTTHGFFGGSSQTKYNIEGYGFGIGKSIDKNNKQLAFLLGYEIFENKSFEISNYNNDYNQYKYSKIYGMFNLMFFNRKSEIGISNKLSYFKILDHISTDYLTFTNETNFVFCSTFNFNYYATKNLKFCSQVGISAHLSNLYAKVEYEYGSSSKSEYLINPILNLGLKYDLSTIKN